MRREEINKDLESASFEYFYWLSRFEFALKENRYLKSIEPEVKAEPSWERFKERYKTNYIPSNEAMRLIELHPKRQFVNAHHELDWKPVGLDNCSNHLCKIVILLNTVRNNLFHGGKHGDNDMDNIERNLELLRISMVILDQLAKYGNVYEDYIRYY